MIDNYTAMLEVEVEVEEEEEEPDPAWFWKYSNLSAAFSSSVTSVSTSPLGIGPPRGLVNLAVAGSCPPPCFAVEWGSKVYFHTRWVQPLAGHGTATFVAGLLSLDFEQKNWYLNRPCDWHRTSTCALVLRGRCSSQVCELQLPHTPQEGCRPLQHCA